MGTTQDSAIPVPQLHLLLVANSEEDFLYLRNLLNRAGDGLIHLDHARTHQEALRRLGETRYDVLLCDYNPGEGTALSLLSEIHRHGHPGIPVIFLSDHVSEAAVAEAVQAGACDGGQTPGLDESSRARIVRGAIDVYCKERQRQKAEDMLRKLWRAV